MELKEQLHRIDEIMRLSQDKFFDMIEPFSKMSTEEVGKINEYYCKRMEEARIFLQQHEDDILLLQKYCSHWLKMNQESLNQVRRIKAAYSKIDSKNKKNSLSKNIPVFNKLINYFKR